MAPVSASGREYTLKECQAHLDSLRPADTRVFWDIEDFPVPSGRSINALPEGVRTSLFIEDYGGDLSFWVYTGKLSQNSLNHLEALRFVVGQHSDNKALRLHCMLIDMMFWAHRNPLDGSEERIVNFLVIAKDIPKDTVDTKFAATLAELDKRGYNVLLVVPDGTPTLDQEPFRDATIVWHWTKLFDGGQGSFPLDSDSEEECSDRPHLFVGIPPSGVKRPEILSVPVDSDSKEECPDGPSNMSTRMSARLWHRKKGPI